MSNRRNVSECPTQIYAAIQPTVSEHDIDLLVCDCILHSFKLMFSFLSFIPNSFLTKINFFCSMWSITMSMFGHPATKTDVECYPFFIDYISLPPPLLSPSFCSGAWNTQNADRLGRDLHPIFIDFFFLKSLLVIHFIQGKFCLPFGIFLRMIDDPALPLRVHFAIFSQKFQLIFLIESDEIILKFPRIAMCFIRFVTQTRRLDLTL